MYAVSLTLEIAISTFVFVFFSFKYPPSSNLSHCTLTASYLLPSVLMYAEMTALHLKMPHQLYCCLSNPFEVQWKPSHPQPAPSCLSWVCRQCEHYNVGSFGVKNGAFLIFCLVHFPYSQLGWQLECCYTLHASVKPGYSPPQHTVLLCFDTKRSLYTYTCFSAQYVLHEWVHTGTHTGTLSKEYWDVPA